MSDWTSTGSGSDGILGRTDENDLIALHPDCEQDLLPTELKPGLMPPAILPFQGIHKPDSVRPESFNDDLSLSAFRKGDKIWAGQQRKGIQYSIPDASSKLDHIERASREPFHLSGRIPLPGELRESIQFIRPVSLETVVHFGDAQLGRIEALISESAPFQAEWDSSIPERIRSAAGFVKTVALSELTHQFGMRGDLWLRQFIFGFDILGSFSQRGVFPVCAKTRPPASPDILWEDAELRFSSRARASPSAHAGAL